MFVTRFGWICEKVGMSSIVCDGVVQGITLLKIFKQNVLNKQEFENGVVLTIGIEKFKLKNKPQIQSLLKNDKPMCKIVKEFRVLKEESDDLGECYGIELFKDGMFVDVSSKGTGKGFAGGMKRWNFQGAGASHGNSLAHRTIGSTGTRDKIFKGKKMPGRLGGKRITVQNLRVCLIDADLGVVGVNGSVPGKNGTLVEVKKAVKKVVLK